MEMIGVFPNLLLNIRWKALGMETQITNKLFEPAMDVKREYWCVFFV